MVVAGSRPGRVNLIGEHVDYNGGRCLPIALTQSDRATSPCVTTASAAGHQRGRGPGRVALDELDDADPWALYVAGVLLALDVTEGMAIEITSDVPIGAGLSSSAALECSVAVALDELLDLGRSDEELVAACVLAEQKYVGAPTGGLDQAIAIHARGRAGPAAGLRRRRRRARCRSTRPPTGSPYSSSTRGSATSSPTAATGRAGTRRGRRPDCSGSSTSRRPPTSTGLPEPLLRRARHVVTEVARVDAFVDALHRDDWAALGPLLDASHASLRDDYEVSCEELDVTVEVARQAGALGARMTGGGFGGSAIALVPVGAGQGRAGRRGDSLRRPRLGCTGLHRRRARRRREGYPQVVIPGQTAGSAAPGRSRPGAADSLYSNHAVSEITGLILWGGVVMVGFRKRVGATLVATGLVIAGAAAAPASAGSGGGYPGGGSDVKVITKGLDGPFGLDGLGRGFVVAERSLGRGDQDRQVRRSARARLRRTRGGRCRVGVGTRLLGAGGTQRGRCPAGRHVPARARSCAPIRGRTGRCPSRTCWTGS